MIELLHSKYEGCKNNYCADGGDMIEGIKVDDPRFSLEKLTEPLVTEQMDGAVEKREAIKDLLLYILMGNHEYILRRFGDITEWVCKKLSIPYGTYSTILTVTDSKGELMYKTFDTHGNKTITSTADDPKRRQVNMELILKRQLRHKVGDCAVMIKHHAHKLIACKPEAELYLIDDGKSMKQAHTSWGQSESYIHPDARWYGCAGSFLKLYGKDISGYAEIGEYDPVELGFLILRVRNKKIVSLDPYYLKI